MRQVTNNLIKFFVGPIRIIEAKANGITFDPYGKFMAT